MQKELTKIEDILNSLTDLPQSTLKVIQGILTEREELRAQVTSLKQHLHEWWRAASAIRNSEPDSEEERAAWGSFDSLRTGNSYSDAGLPIVEWLIKERDSRDKRITELENCLKALEQTLVIHPDSCSGADGFGNPYDLRKLVQLTLKGDVK